jgi:hypothetical protein
MSIIMSSRRAFPARDAPRAFAAGGDMETRNETALKCAVLQVVARPVRDAFTAVDFTEIAMFAGLLDEIDSKP